MIEINKLVLVELLNEVFENKDGYIGWERTIQKTIINGEEILTNVYRSDQSSIYYNYKINMNATISDISVQIEIDTKTSSSNGDPYCGRGMNNTSKDNKFTKGINEFKTHEEIVSYIRSIFYEHYFRIYQRN